MTLSRELAKTTDKNKSIDLRLLLVQMALVEVWSALGVLLRVLRLMRKVKQSAWRGQGDQGRRAGWME
jgi:hypothetical protein